MAVKKEKRTEFLKCLQAKEYCIFATFPNVAIGGCDGKIINSHSISESIALSKISFVEGNERLVYGLHIYDKRIEFDKEKEFNLQKINVGNASAYKGVCHKHDEIFYPVDNLKETPDVDVVVRLMIRSGARNLYKIKHHENTLKNIRGKGFFDFGNLTDAMNDAVAEGQLKPLHEKAMRESKAQFLYVEKMLSIFSEAKYEMINFRIIGLGKRFDVLVSEMISLRFDQNDNLFSSEVQDEFIHFDLINTDDESYLVFSKIGHFNSAVNGLIDFLDKSDSTILSSFILHHCENFFWKKNLSDQMADDLIRQFQYEIQMGRRNWSVYRKVNIFE